MLSTLRSVCDLRKWCYSFNTINCTRLIGSPCWGFSFFIDPLCKLLYRSHFETEMLPRNNSSPCSSVCSLDANNIFLFIAKVTKWELSLFLHALKTWAQCSTGWVKCKHVFWKKKRKMSLSMLIVYWGIFYFFLRILPLNGNSYKKSFRP